jgi:hypothetical protein
MPIACMLFQRGTVRRLLKVLAACLADDGLGCCIGLQLRRRSFGGIFGVALALRLRFGTVAHFKRCCGLEKRV